jgi:MPBQ/MSBQ methyltransferase
VRALDGNDGTGARLVLAADSRGLLEPAVDLTPEYCRVGNMLTETGLVGQVELVRADALELPFTEGSFDAVWTEHAAMNIADKPRLYREVRRVLRSGGRLALYDVVAGEGGDLYFPVPWARRPRFACGAMSRGRRSSGFA